MAEPSKPVTRKPPKGGSKGGTRFPRLGIAEALTYSKKLVSKTHNAPQPEDEILPGVFGTSGPSGQVRASALKQFGLMQGDAKAYEASQLAKDIDRALPGERPALLQRAVRAPKVFDKIFDTFHGDTVSKAQIAKRSRELEVHPDSADECSQIFIDSAVTAGLGTLSGENISLINANDAPSAGTAAGQGGDEHEDEAEKLDTPPDESINSTNAESAANNERDTRRQNQSSGANKGAVTVNLAVDSSSDPDKLEKQLKLLKQYGLLR
jgi:hypothetical protein